MAILKRTTLAWACALCLWAGAREAGGQNAREYDLKATFLFNFAQFVTWPSNAFTAPDAPFTIGVLGEDPFDAALDDLVRHESVGGHPLVVRRYRSVKDIEDCQILFISKSEKAKAAQVLSALKGRRILTVGESEDIAANGGIIQFFTERNKVRLRINTAAAKAEKLTISSKLLRLAELVSEPPNGK